MYITDHTGGSHSPWFLLWFWWRQAAVLWGVRAWTPGGPAPLVSMFPLLPGLLPGSPPLLALHLLSILLAALGCHPAGHKTHRDTLREHRAWPVTYRYTYGCPLDTHTHTHTHTHKHAHTTHTWTHTHMETHT